MHPVKYEEIIDIIKRHDVEDQFEEYNETEIDENLVQEISEYFSSKYKRYAVVGIDIYKYSNYEKHKQSLIPILFQIIYSETVKNCLKYEPFLFQKIGNDDFIKSFISTGDGGFQLMPTPLHALTFIVYFEANLRIFNSYKSYPKLRQWIGKINLRYCITYDELFQLDNNYYGTAIINNSRLLSKDTLNRFLIEDNTYDWFLRTVRGMETLVTLDIGQIDQLEEFNNYDKKHDIKDRSLILSLGSNNINLLHLQKIGLVKSKKQEIDVYNVFLQVALRLKDPKNEGNNHNIVVSIGNTNTSGLE